MSITTCVKFYHVGDTDKNGTVLIVLPTRKSAMKYLKEWVVFHSTKMYPYSKNKDGSYHSKFTRVYLDSQT